MSTKLAIAAVLLQLGHPAWAHGTDGREGFQAGTVNTPETDGTTSGGGIHTSDQPSYAGLGMHENLIVARIVLLILAWFLVLPLGMSADVSLGEDTNTMQGVVSSIARSRFAVAIQALFLLLNSIGVLLGTAYNTKTPDLYPNNAHQKVGWISTWVMIAQTSMGLLLKYARRDMKYPGIRAEECVAILPMSVANMDYHNNQLSTLCRRSDDGGEGSWRSSTLYNASDVSGLDAHPQDNFDRFERTKLEADEDDDDAPAATQPRARFCSRPGLLQCVSGKVPGLCSQTWQILEVAYNAIDRLILLLGFVALCTGAVTYTSIFVSPHTEFFRRRSQRVFKLTIKSARQAHLQRPCSFHQRRYLFLVWAIDLWTLDGLLCRRGLGLECQTN